jgi:hypothetical protein
VGPAQARRFRLNQPSANSDKIPIDTTIAEKADGRVLDFGCYGSVRMCATFIGRRGVQPRKTRNVRKKLAPPINFPIN